MPVIDQLQYVALDELTLWDRNPRKISPARFDALCRSLSEDPRMMTARPLIAMNDGRIIAGNMRYRAAEKLGWTEVPVVYVDIDESRAATWAIRDNVGYGEWEDQGLADLLRELETNSVDLELTGLIPDDITALFAEYAAPDAEPEPDDRGTDLRLADVSVGDPKHEVETGDVYQLGPHLLVVADVYEDWPTWVGRLEEGMLLVPYPTPTLPLTQRARENAVLMIQPDRWLAGHVIDKWVAVRGADTLEKVA